MTDMREKFYDFVLARQLAWFNRHVLCLPRAGWTTDPILQVHRFTNVYRFLDRGTQFAVGEILEREGSGPVPMNDGGRLHLTVEGLQDLLIYRYTNNIQTFLNVRSAVEYGEWHIVQEVLEAMRERGETLYTNAYITTYCPSWVPGEPIKSLVRQLQYLYDAAYALHVTLSDANSGRMAFQAIEALRGVGPFLAYQLLGDLRTPLAQAGGPALAIDTENWCHVGAGALAGLKLVLGDGFQKFAAVGACQALRDGQVMAFARGEERGNPRFPYVTDFSRDPLFGDPVQLTLHDVEHSLCEFQKYVRGQQDGVVKGRLDVPRPGSKAWRPGFVTLPAYLPRVVAQEVTS
jgi:hypothetical protein